MAVMLHFQSTGTVPGNARPVPMVGRSLTVGRGADNDLMLPDPGRAVSSHHCAIEDHGGNVVVIDLSTNGTFLNYGKTPLGRVPTPLNDGDILSIGAYELLVEITSPRAVAPHELPPAADPTPTGGGDWDRSFAMPGGPLGLLGDAGGLGAGPGGFGGGPTGERDFLDELLGDNSAPAGPRSIRRPELGEDGLMGPLGEEDDPLVPRLPHERGGASLPDHAPAEQDHFRPYRTAAEAIPDDWHLDGAPGDTAEARTSDPSDVDPFAFTPPSRLLGPAPAGTCRDSASDAAARAFLRAMGVESLAVPDKELVETLSRLGHAMRIMIHGMREVLMTRAHIKHEFVIQQTVIGRAGNNPLKFSVSPEQAVQAMVRPNQSGYLDAVDAAEQALADIRAHEVAVVSGMEAAIKGVLRQLSPEALEAQIAGGGLGDALKGRKTRYWEAYEKMFARISDQAESDFHELFRREFARAYQKQLERLK